jgi:hypothetical protein
MATGPCQAGFAETHNYIYLGGIVYNVSNPIKCSEGRGILGWHRPKCPQHELFIGFRPMSVAVSLHLIGLIRCKHAININ